ncbi:hypothetical protein ACLEDP_16415 [Lonsdalea quercina]|uniref:hypothetical protein n=1 Tax=Lonsdalea quercina TaxID=71657 RepID=UPI00397526AF
MLQSIEQLAKKDTTMAISPTRGRLPKAVAVQVIVMADDRLVEQGPGEQVISFADNLQTQRPLRPLPMIQESTESVI